MQHSTDLGKIPMGMIGKVIIIMQKNTITKPLNQNKMKIEITSYGHKATYEFEHEDVSLEDLIYHLDKLIKLVGYPYDGELQISKSEEL